MKNDTILSELGQAAVEYAKMKLAVLPLQPGDKVTVSGSHGFHQASTDPERIAKWWTNVPELNIGISCGKPSGNLVVIDLDVDDDMGIDGRDALAEWENEHGYLPDTVCSITGGGGNQYFFHTPTPLHPSVNHDLGVDIRADGSYVVAPPSLHPSGRRYEWEHDPTEYQIADADENVLAFIEHVQGQRGESEKFKLPESICNGERNNTLFRYASSLQARGLADDFIFNAVHDANRSRCNPPVGEEDIRKLVQSALKYDKCDTITPVTICDDIELNRLKNGKVKQTVSNFCEVLENDGALKGLIRYNSLEFAPYICGELPWCVGAEYRRWQDSDYSSLRRYMDRYDLSSKDALIDAVTVVSHDNSYNPAADFLETLPTWDGKNRVSMLLAWCFGAEMSEYQARVMHLFMWGAIARAYEPGTKFDYLPVLVGEQGIGKSMFVRRLAVNPTWYDDNFNTIDGDKAAEKLRGKWIVEIAELLAMKKAREIEAVKSFVTSTVDNYRPAYARMTELHPRACVFFGTTNTHGFLIDKTGNRRFLPIDLPPRNTSHELDLYDADTCTEVFIQAWAEALHEWRSGVSVAGDEVSLRMPDTFGEMAEEQQTAHMEDDPRVGMVENYLDEYSAATGRVCAAELVECILHISPGDRTYQMACNQMHEIMARYFPEWKRSDGKRRCGKYGIQRCYEMLLHA